MHADIVLVLLIVLYSVSCQAGLAKAVVSCEGKVVKGSGQLRSRSMLFPWSLDRFAVRLVAGDQLTKLNVGSLPTCLAFSKK